MYFGYPFTPQNELTIHGKKGCLRTRRIFIQSRARSPQSTWSSGKRSRPGPYSSSSPDKPEQEAYPTGSHELPVIVDMVREPGMGYFSGPVRLPAGNQRRGHGTTEIVLAPASVQEMTDLVPLAFDLADGTKPRGHTRDGCSDR